MVVGGVWNFEVREMAGVCFSFWAYSLRATYEFNERYALTAGYQDDGISETIGKFPKIGNTKG